MLEEDYYDLNWKQILKASPLTSIELGVDGIKRQVTQLRCVGCQQFLEISDQGTGKLVCPSSEKVCKVMYFSTTTNKFYYVEGYEPKKEERKNV